MVKLKEHNCDWCCKSYASVESLQAHFVAGKHNVRAHLAFTPSHALSHTPRPSLFLFFFAIFVIPPGTPSPQA